MGLAVPGRWQVSGLAGGDVMANTDPRYKNGIKKMVCNPIIKIDRPQDYGWQKSGISPSTGYDIFTHPGASGAEIRAGTLTEGYDWIVCQAGCVYGVDGSLADLTADLTDIPFDGRPGDPGGDPDRDDYGLEAIA